MPRRRGRSTAFPSALAIVLATALGASAQQISAVASPEAARTASLDQVLPVGPDVIVGELDNGLQYYVRENDEPDNRAQLRLVVNVGAAVEDEDQLGLAHLLEHMAFNGSTNFEKQELLAFMESIGMRLGIGVNASTSFDVTNYRLEVPADDPEIVSAAVQILEDWAHGLTLDPEEVDQERDVVLEEIRLRSGAQWRLMEAQYPVLFEGSPYAVRTLGGTEESIRTFSHEALARFYDDWYRPDLMGVIAVGDFDGAEMEALIRDRFSAIEGPADPRPRPDLHVPPHDETRYSIISDPELSSTTVRVYTKEVDVPDNTVGGYRDQLVRGMYTSMLNDRLREIALRPDAPFLGASVGRYRIVGDVAVRDLSTAVVDGGVEEGLEALLAEAERAARFGFTPSELDRQRTERLRGIEQAYRTRGDRSSTSFTSEYTRALLEDEPIPGIEYEYELYRRFIPEITLEEVDALARDWIREANRVVLVEAPEDLDTPPPDEATLAAILDGVESRELTAYEDALTDAVLLADVPAGSPVVETRELDRGIIEWRLENGVLVVLKPTDYDEDRVAFRGFSEGGVSLVEAADLVPATTASQLVSGSGLGSFDQVDLGRVLTGRVASASPFISEFEEGVSGSASTDDLETMFQLIYMRFTHPRADPDYFSVWTAQMRQALANRDADPVTAWSDAYNRLMTGDAPRERPMQLQDLEEADLEESLAFYEDRFGDASDFTFVFVGNIEPEVFRPLVETYLGGLPGAGREEAWVDRGVRIPEGVHEEVVSRGIESQSQTILTFHGPFDYDDQLERSGIRALALALDSHLMEHVREEMGGVYSISVGPGVTWRPEETYQMNVVFGSDPGRVDEILDRVFEEIEAFKENGPTETQVTGARETILRQFETDFQENGTWLSQLASDYQRGVAEPAAAVDTFEASVEAITVESMRDAARRYFDTENYVRVTLIPE